MTPAIAIVGSTALGIASGWFARSRFRIPKGRPTERINMGRTAAAGLGDAVRLDYAKAEISIYVTSDMERRYRSKSCRKEPWTVEWLDEYVHPDDVVYDIGANVGTFTLIAAVARGAFVVAFEPAFANYARLCENIALNGCGNRVLIVPLPLSNRTELLSFEYRDASPGQSRHTIHHGTSDSVASPRFVQRMSALRLDDARRDFHWPWPNHIKLDVDGEELRVLQGATGILTASSLRTMLVEADGVVWSELVGILAVSGFEMVRRIDRDDAPTYAIFARNSPHPFRSSRLTR